MASITVTQNNASITGLGTTPAGQTDVYIYFSGEVKVGAALFLPLVLGFWKFSTHGTDIQKETNLGNKKGQYCQISTKGVPNKHTIAKETFLAN